MSRHTQVSAFFGAVVLIGLIGAFATTPITQLNSDDADSLVEPMSDRAVAAPRFQRNGTLAHIDAEPTVRFDPETLNLGMTMKGVTRSSSLRLINDGDSAIEIMAIATDCGCVSVDAVTPLSIPAKTSVDFPLQFKAPGRAGRTQRSTLAATLANGESVQAAVVSRIVEVVAIKEQTIASPTDQDAVATLVAMDLKSFSLISADPPIVEVMNDSASEIEVHIASSEWRTAGSPRVIVLHTDHPASPVVALRFNDEAQDNFRRRESITDSIR